MLRLTRDSRGTAAVACRRRSGSGTTDIDRAMRTLVNDLSPAAVNHQGHVNDQKIRILLADVLRPYSFGVAGIGGILAAITSLHCELSIGTTLH